MIIEADFLNHWKTKALGNAIGDLAAIRALLSLWAHCQKRRAWEFRLTSVMLAGICDYHGDKTQIDAFWESMRELQFIDPTPESGWFRVHEWGETNISLVAKWAAPMKRKAADYPPRGSKASTQDTSNDYSSDHSLDASSVPAIGLDRIGEDRIGLDGSGEKEKEEGLMRGAGTLRWFPESGWQGVDDALLTELGTAYPACNVPRQLLCMEQWLKANPAKAKKSNWRRFVNNWLKAEQDRGGDLHTLPPPTSQLTSGTPFLAQKKEGGPPPDDAPSSIKPADFPWRAVAENCEGWIPEGEWEDQTVRSRKTLRETWTSLSTSGKAAISALAQGGAKAEPA